MFALIPLCPAPIAAEAETIESADACTVAERPPVPTAPLTPAVARPVIDAATPAERPDAPERPKEADAMESAPAVAPTPFEETPAPIVAMPPRVAATLSAVAVVATFTATV